MFNFMDFGEISLYLKARLLDKLPLKILMGSHVDKFIKERQLTLVVNNAN